MHTYFIIYPLSFYAHLFYYLFTPGSKFTLNLKFNFNWYSLVSYDYRTIIAHFSHKYHTIFTLIAGPLPETIGTESPFNYNFLHLNINDLLKFFAKIVHLCDMCKKK